jgi:1-acyl-sn-glycerol-3-phosphate acyltransferase
MPALKGLFVAAAIWIVVVLLIRWFAARYLTIGPGRDPVLGLMWYVIRVYSRLVHRVTFSGLEHLPRTPDAGPLIVVANHTSSVDPLLIQAACRFHIRWMMAADMMMSSLDWLWKQQRMIAVDRDGSDMRSAREAIRHVREGGVVGIFPEGRIVDPPEQVWPFFSGVGLIVARTEAPVLLAWITGTPLTSNMTRSLFTFSRAHIEFLGVTQFSKSDDPEKITSELRRRIAEASGWPLVDAAPPKTPAPESPFAA